MSLDVFREGYLYPDRSTRLKRFLNFWRSKCPKCECLNVVKDGVHNRYGDPQVHCAACGHVWCWDTQGR